MLAAIQTDLTKGLNNFKATAAKEEPTDFIMRPTESVNISGLTDNRGKLEISSSTQLQVFGKENRTTGYAWEVTKNTCGSKLVQSRDEYGVHPDGVATAEGNMGVGGLRTWWFDTPGENSNHMRGVPCELTFVYKRPWLSEPDSPADIKVVEVTIV